MRRFIVLLVLCLLPTQIAWASAVEYVGHGQNEAIQHFGHHDDAHKAFSGHSSPDQQTEKSSLTHDHCHTVGFLGFLNDSVFHATLPPADSSLHTDEVAYLSATQDRPERPNWSALA